MTPDSQPFLVGSGHFGIGFVLGYILMFMLLKTKSTHLKVQLFAPFIPFILGFWAAIPYLWTDSSIILSSWLHIFLLYPFFHHNELFILLFGKLNLVALICATLYGIIILRYIRLVKYCRAYGWPEGSADA